MMIARFGIDGTIVADNKYDTVFGLLAWLIIIIINTIVEIIGILFGHRYHTRKQVCTYSK